MQGGDVNDNPFDFDLWTDGTMEVNMQDVKLKPCPFCGGEADTYPYYCPDGWYIGCGECSCDLGVFDTKEDAIEAWNKRVGEVTERTQKAVHDMKKQNRNRIG